jgi:hypothetical protein
LVTITHPHHPLCGQQVAIVRVRRGADPDLIVQLPDGTHAAIAMSYTDYAATTPPALRMDAPHLLDLDGLCLVAQLLERLRQEGRLPATVNSPGEAQL